MKAKAVVTIKIHYEEVSSDKDLERALNYAVNHLANNGLLSDEGSIVDEWEHKVEVKVINNG